MGCSTGQRQLTPKEKLEGEVRAAAMMVQHAKDAEKLLKRMSVARAEERLVEARAALEAYDPLGTVEGGNVA